MIWEKRTTLYIFRLILHDQIIYDNKLKYIKKIPVINVTT